VRAYQRALMFAKPLRLEVDFGELRAYGRLARMPAPGKRSPARTAIVAAAVVVALVAFAWGALAFLFPPAKLNQIVTRQLTVSLARPVRFDSVQLFLWPPVRLTIDGPALAEAGGFQRGTVFHARALHLDLDALALFSRRLVVRRLELDGPELHLVIRPDGTTNLDGIGKSAPAGSDRAQKPMDLAVRELTLRDGSVLVDDFGARA
jgi:uncharacterized protein involved in outer membrane biogenesis